MSAGVDREATPGSDGGRTPGRRRRGRRGDRARRGESVVPPAEFTSYYGRPIVKESPWEADIPAYLFAGGLAAGSSLVAAGADLTGRPVLRRAGRLTSLVAVAFSGAALVHDLGRPARFHHMLRVAKPTSPMSVGTWILSVYGPLAGAAAVAEAATMVPPRWLRGPLRLLPLLARPTGIAAALSAPALASYTAVLLADTATPAWHEGFRELPFVFVGSAAAASAGMGLIAAPTSETGPVRRLAVGAAVLELLAERRREESMGMVAEPLHTGTAGRLTRAATVLTSLGAAGALLGGRHRAVAAAAGVCLVVGSVCLRFGVFEAGQASARDPRYTVVPQRERVERRGARATTHWA